MTTVMSTRAAVPSAVPSGSMQVTIVATEHEYGIDIAAHLTDADADAHLVDYVTTWWERELASPCPNPVTSQDVETYFDYFADAGRHESYIRDRVTVEGLDHSPKVGETIHVLIWHWEYHEEIRAYATADLTHAARDTEIRNGWARVFDEPAPDVLTQAHREDYFEHVSDESVTTEAVTIRATRRTN